MQRRSSPTGIKYISMLEPTGYGEAARRCILGLIQKNVPLTWTPMVHGTSWGLWYEAFLGKKLADLPLLSNSLTEAYQGLDTYCNKVIDYDTVIIHGVPEYYPQWVKREKGKKIFGYVTWETDKIPKHWLGLLNSVDAVLVPSTWNQEVFIRSGIRVPVHVVPHIADTVAKPVLQLSTKDITTAEYIFYSINTWTNRKALPSMIETYLKTFTAKDSVRFILKTSKKSFIRSRNPIVRFLQNRFPADTIKLVKKLSRNFRHTPR